MRARGLAIVVGLALPALVPARAADQAPPPAEPGFIVTVGAEGRFQPRYLGADDHVLRPYPILSWRRAGTPARFRSPRDGFGLALLDTGTLAIGPVGQLVWRRKESASPALRGLGDVGATVELGAFLDYWAAPWLRGRVELRNGLGGHHGLLADFAIDAAYPLAPQWTLSGGPRARIASGATVSPYFDVTPAQAAASGLPVFDAGGGVQSLGAGAQARYQLSPAWATHVFIEYDRLLGDTADSPLVALRGSANQLTVGAGLTYSFDLGWR